MFPLLAQFDQACAVRMQPGGGPDLFQLLFLHHIPTGSEVFGKVASLGSEVWVAFAELRIACPPSCPVRRILQNQFLCG